MTHRDTVCLLCGLTSPDVALGLIAWKEPVGRDVFTTAPRCKDAEACRARIEAAGDVWELVDPKAELR